MSILSQLLPYVQLPAQSQDLLQAQRLFHGRGHAYDGLDHITIDWLPPVILITLYAPEPAASVKELADNLLSLLPDCKSIQLQCRYELSGPVSIIYGESIHDLAITEGNCRFHIRLGQSRNTGLFLDMRNGRQWVQEYSNKKRVLNLFAYTCGFSVAAKAGGAEAVLNVDMSSAALQVGRDNHHLNEQSLDGIRFEKLNIFKSFGRLKKRGPFDLLICDPPSFQKGSVDIVRDYPKILRRLDDFMAPQSELLLCLNSPDLNREFLINLMAELAPGYALIDEIKPPSVFVEAQRKGLKVLYFKNY